MKLPARFRTFHFVGIAGAGMSVLAKVLLSQGFRVSGSDKSGAEDLEGLRALGATVFAGHASENVGDADLLVYSAAVPADNPELVAAAARGIPSVKRAVLLGEFTREKRTLAVAGTHGKTTTTLMLAEIFRQAGRRALALAGGSLQGPAFSEPDADAPVVIVEADEYDHSFLQLHPSAILLNNIDADHLDYFGSRENLHQAFRDFTERLPFYGTVYANRDDAGVESMVGKIRRPMKTFSAQSEADYQAVATELTAGGTRFTLLAHGEAAGEIKLTVPGMHNVMNALGAAAVALEEEIPFADVAAGLAGFSGARRRFDFLGEKRSIRFFDDYAHHPTEVAAVLEAARQLRPKRLVAVFQPHLYSRTQALAEEFAAALAAADVVLVSGVYGSREARREGVDGHLIADVLRKQGRDAVFPGNLEACAQVLTDRALPGDLILFMGAGDIGEHARKVVAEWA